MIKVTITLELPPKELSPNVPGGSKWKWAYVKKYRQHAMEEMQVALKEQGVDVDKLPLKQATSQETFFWKTRIRRDVRNAEAKMKAAYDGFVQGGLLEDDDYKHLTHLATRFEFDKENPRVEITIEEVA